MNLSTIHQEDPVTWAERNFGDIDLGDQRRNQRAVTIAAAMASNPDRSIPQMFLNTYDVKAAYNFFRHPDSTPENLQQTHREHVLGELEKPGKYLLLEDTSEIYCSNNNSIDGLGPIGSSNKLKRGFHLHTILAVRWEYESSSVEQGVHRPNVEVLGLPVQHFNIRKRMPEGERKKGTAEYIERERESDWWHQAGESLGPSPTSESLRWIRVCDRGADIYEQLLSCQTLNHSYAIRSSVNRTIIDLATGEVEGRLFEIARSQSSLGEFSLDLRSRPSKSKRVTSRSMVGEEKKTEDPILYTKPARTVLLKISSREVCIRSPRRPGSNKRGQLPSIHCNVVRVWEETPPEGEEALEWMILTDTSVINYHQALEIALIYSTRWLIEEFHKALKTGNKAEELQLETAEGLFAAIAIKSIVALRLIDLRERVRLKADAPASDSGLDELELLILSQSTNRKLKTVSDVALAIGRLGGHMNRKRDGLPGWITLFRGMSVLNNFVVGARLALKLKRFG